MTKREKTLIQIAVILVLIIVPYYLFTRNIVKVTKDLRNDIKVLLTQEQDYIATMDMMAKTEAYLEQIKAELATKMPNTENLAKTYEIHYEFVNILNTSGLDVRRISFDDPKEIKSIDYPTKDRTQEYADIALMPDEVRQYTVPAEYKVSSVNVIFSARGSVDSIMSTLDKINELSEYIEIDAINIPDTGKGSQADVEAIVTIYMVTNQDGGAIS